VICKTLRVVYEQPRPAERKTFCHYADPGLKLATGGQCSLCVHGGAHFIGHELITDIITI
jgi:hypothetical protein